MFDIPFKGVYQVGDLDARDVFTPVNGNLSVEPLDVGNADYTAHCPKTVGAGHQSLSLHLPDLPLQAGRKAMVICQSSRLVDDEDELETYWLFSVHGAVYASPSSDFAMSAFIGVGTTPEPAGPGATVELEGGRRTLVSAGTTTLDVKDVFVSRRSTTQGQIKRPIFVGIEFVNHSTSGAKTLRGDVSLSLRRSGQEWPMRSVRAVS